jgi:hypothetical protein
LGFFVLSVALLHPHDYSRAGLSTENHTFIDIVVGSTFPVPLSAGGARKVILENPKGERGQIIWTVFWVLSSAVCTISLVLTYIALRSGRTDWFPDIMDWIEIHVPPPYRGSQASIYCKPEREVMERGWGTREDKNTKACACPGQISMSYTSSWTWSYNED